MKFYVCLAAALFGSPQGRAQLHPSAFRIETIAGSPRNGDGGPATAAQISNIQGIAVDHAGNLYLSDTDNHRVRRVTPAGVITTIAGTGRPGYSGDNGPAAQAQLNLPYGLAVDATGDLYIADLGNNRVRRISPDGAITTVAPGATLAGPRNLAIDSAGNLYISEFSGHRVRRVAPDGKISTVAGTGKPGYSGDGGPPDQAQLAYPAGIAIDRGALLIADSQNNRVRRIFASGIIATVLGGSAATALANPIAVAADFAGNVYVGDSAPVVRALSLAGKWTDAAGGAVPGYSGDGDSASRAGLTAARDLAFDSAGNLYIADGPRVRRVDPLGIITTVAGDGYLHAIGDGGPAADALLSRPASIALDPSGALAIADSGTHRVRRVTSDGVITTLLEGLNSPAGVADDAGATVYIADAGSSAIKAIGSDGKARTLAAGAVRAPRGLCLGRGGSLYVLDTGDGRVLRVGSAVEILATQLSAPEACAVDSAGNLFIADTGNHRVRKLSPDGALLTVAGTGEPASDGDGGPAVSARIAYPRGIAVDDAGSLYIADSAGNRIRLVTPDGVIHTIAGTGDADFGGDGGPAAEASLNTPAGLALDGAGGLYVADSGNDRVRHLVPDSSLPVALAPPVTVSNLLSGAGGAIAPGELITIMGKGIASGSGAEVWFGAAVGTVLFLGDGQINAQVPYSLAAGSALHLEVRIGGKAVGAADLAVADAAPGVLIVTLNEDGSVNCPLQPAGKGSLLTLFATGEGVRAAAWRARVSVAGVDAEVVRVEEAAGGLLKILLRIPGGFVPSGPVPAVFFSGNGRSLPVTVWLR